MSDLTGQQFGGFKVVQRAAARDRVRYWELSCLGCGLIREEMQVSLKHGFVPECDGCGDSADPFAWDERADVVVLPPPVEVTHALVDDPAWIWPWQKPEPKTLTPDEAAEDLYARIDARIEAERAAIEASVIVDVAADTNGPTAEIESDVSLVEEPEDLFSQFADEPAVAKIEDPRPSWVVDGACCAAMPECEHQGFDASLIGVPCDCITEPASNPIADAVDSIAAALTELAKALRG